MRKLAVLLATIALLALSLPAIAQPTGGQLSIAEQDRLVREAIQRLDEPAETRQRLPEAGQLLQSVLAANPAHVPARIAMARYYLESGRIDSIHFRPGALEAADRELMLAVAADPNAVDAYILHARILIYGGIPDGAIDSLRRAEALGGDSTSIDLAWAHAASELGNLDEAEARLRRVESRYANQRNAPVPVMVALYERLAWVYERTGRFDQADRAYRRLLSLQPKSAWAHGNFASFLLFRRGKADAAIVEANKAIAIMDYGHVRRTLGSAQYFKWARLKAAAPANAARYLALAKRNAPDPAEVLMHAAAAVEAVPAMATLVEALVETGLSIDARDRDGDTALTISASAGNLVAVTWLLRHGADVDARNNARRTALYLAAMRDNRAIAELLLANHANPNLADFGGFTPLVRAASSGHEQIVRMLLSAGADPTLKTAGGQDAASLADFNRQPEIGQLIRSNIAKQPANNATPP